MKDVDSLLKDKIKEALYSIEESGDIVIVSTVLGEASRLIAEKTKEAYVGGIFTHEELVFFRQLTSEAARNTKLFNGEMRTLTNYGSEEAEALSEKLRELTSYY